MKTYKITITSNQNKNVSQTYFFATSLPKGFLMDILCPLTKYQISIEEVKDGPAFALSIEGLLNIIKDIKLKTKIAKNVMEVKKGTLGIFSNKPELILNTWQGNCGETRTYINNMYFSDINKMFPEIFKQDPKNKHGYFEGELFLDNTNEVWELRFVKSTHKVIYEEIILES